jgi:hypothetical protein
MKPHRLLLLLVAALLAVAAGTGTQFSSASFTSTSARPVAVSAANDWTPPTVALTDPGSPLSGTVTLSATAADARSSVASVVVEQAPNGSSTWTAVCTDTVAPYTCSWATTSVADGNYQLRATATDTAGYSATSSVITAQVVNSATQVMDPIDDVVRGNVALRAVTSGAGAATVTMRFEYSIADSGSWATIAGCGNATGTTRTCTWTTTGAETYDVRAVAVVGSRTFYDTEYDILVDNVAPTATLGVPGGTLRGTVDLTASADDGDSGLDTVTVQYKLASASTWAACGTGDDSPYVCQLDTAALANGSYNFRAVAVDAAGNSTTTSTTTRTVDNTAPSVSITSPANGATLSGTTTITAAASAVQGVSSVRIEARAGTSGAFSPVCTDTSAPYACTYDTSTAANGTYQIQAVLVPTSGASVTSSVVTVTVDNAPLKAQDVQTVDVASANRPAAGDKLVLTYSARVDLATIKNGWTGTSTTVGVSFKDKNVTGAAIAGYDRMEVTDANLGQVAFTQNFVSGNRTVVLTGSTMVASTATVNGVQVTVVTITLGTPSNNSWLRRSNSTGVMRWTPSTAARNLAGVACSAAYASESGTNDRDF